MICISGTPGVGKTTVMKEMKRKGYGAKEFDSILEKCFVGIEDGEKIVDEDCLKGIRQEGIYFGHLSHYAKCDIVIVLRSHLREIYSRLEKRGYPRSKIMDNLECEAIDLIGSEAEMLHPGMIYEVLNEKIDATMDEIENIIKGKNSTRVKIDLTEEILDWY
jgi:adenylate kinase